MKHHFYLDPFETRMSNEEAQQIFDTFVEVDRSGAVVSGIHLLKFENQIIRFFMELLLGVESVTISYDTKSNIKLFKSRLHSPEFKYLKNQCCLSPEGVINSSGYDSCLFWVKCACREIVHSKFTLDNTEIQSFDEFVFEFTVNDSEMGIIDELSRKHGLYKRNK